MNLQILDDKALTVIFANVEDILLANTSFLSSLEQRQKSCRLYIDVIGDILDDCMPSMQVYTVSVNRGAVTGGPVLIAARRIVSIRTKLESSSNPFDRPIRDCRHTCKISGSIIRQ